MYRYFEYTDSEGKRWGAMQNTPGDNVRSHANRNLMHQARVSRWKDVEAFPEKMPEWEIKGRINAIRKRNGESPLYPEADTKDPGLRPAISIPKIILTDHGAPEGKQRHEADAIIATSGEHTMEPPIQFAPDAAPPVAIVDHGAPEAPQAGLPPLIVPSQG